jgi:hypothetical protein
MEKYVFKTTHEPLDLSLGLFKIAKDNPPDWDLIRDVLERNKDQLTDLRQGEDYSVWIQKILSLSFGQLLEQCFSHLPSGCEIITIFSDLLDDFQPLKLTPESTSRQELYTDLGSDVIISTIAQGIPSPMYHWFFWSHDESNKDWTALSDVHGKEITIDALRLCESGIYRCYVNHCLRVADPSGQTIPGIYSGGTEVIVNPDSILIFNQPEVEKSAILLDNVQFECDAESPSALKYQWFHEDKVLVGQCVKVLKLNKVNLDQRGRYHCRVTSNLGNSVESKTAILEVTLPTFEQFQELQFDHEHIVILHQPSMPMSNAKAAIGEKVHLSCLAASKWPLKYEWLKRGVQTDLISRKASVFLEPEPVGYGAQLIDELQDANPPVSSYLYQCIITCPTTGERMTSGMIKVPMSTFTLPDKSLPEFKIALVICQEEYDNQDYFHSLLAPRADGKGLIKALQELDFQVNLVNLI